MKVRQNLYLDRAAADALTALAAGRGGNKSRIVNDALAAWLAHRASGQLDDKLKLRLERMARDQARIARDLDVLLESFGLFVRHQLLVSAALPDADPAALMVGRARFDRFIGQVGRQLASGKRTLGAATPQEPVA